MAGQILKGPKKSTHSLVTIVKLQNKDSTNKMIYIELKTGCICLHLGQYPCELYGPFFILGESCLPQTPFTILLKCDIDTSIDPVPSGGVH